MNTAAPIAEIAEFSLCLPGGRHDLIERACLAIRPGERLAVVGESGAGKTMLMRALAGLIPPGARVGGRVLHGGRAIVTEAGVVARPDWGRAVALMGQDGGAELHPHLTVGRQIGDVLAAHGGARRGAARAAAVAQALAALGFEDPDAVARLLPGALSGGMCRRVGLARLLACPARLVIADEPTAGLDAPAAAEALSLLAERAGGEGQAAVIVTHDLGRAAAWASRIVVIHAGQIVEDAPAGVLLTRPRHPLTQALLAAAPALARSLADLRPLPGDPPDLAADALAPCRFAARCPAHLPACDRAAPPVVTLADGARLRCHRVVAP